MTVIIAPFHRSNNPSIVQFIRNKNDIALSSCPICYDDIDFGANNIIVTGCGHRFHASCLIKYFSTSHKYDCPMCRHVFEQDDSDDSSNDDNNTTASSDIDYDSDYDDEDREINVNRLVGICKQYACVYNLCLLCIAYELFDNIYKPTNMCTSYMDDIRRVIKDHGINGNLKDLSYLSNSDLNNADIDTNVSTGVDYTYLYYNNYSNGSSDEEFNNEMTKKITIEKFVELTKDIPMQDLLSMLVFECFSDIVSYADTIDGDEDDNEIHDLMVKCDGIYDKIELSIQHALDALDS